MSESMVWWMLLLAGAPYIAFSFLALGWLRWWIGAAVLLALLVALANMGDGAERSEAIGPFALIAVLAAGALAGGAWLDRHLRREWGIASDRPVRRIPFLRSLHPRALDAIPGLFAALLCASVAGYSVFLAATPLNPNASIPRLIVSFVPTMLYALYVGAVPYFGVAVALFAGAFVALRDLRALNLPWSAVAGAINGVLVVRMVDTSPTSALIGAAIGMVGGTAGYLELRRRVARYPGPAPGAPTADAPFPRWVRVLVRAARAVGSAVRFAGSLVASGYRAGCDAMGGTSRARPIAALSLAWVGAVAVFAAFGRSSLVSDGFAPEDSAWPATVGAMIVALLVYLVTSAVVARLGQRAAQQVALVSLVVAVCNVAMLRETIYP